MVDVSRVAGEAGGGAVGTCKALGVAGLAGVVLGVGVVGAEGGAPAVEEEFWGRAGETVLAVACEAL